MKNIAALIDANVALDFVMSREHSDIAKELFSRCSKETLINPPSAAAGKLFAGSALQNLEIHKVFLRFCALIRRKFARHLLSSDLISASLRTSFRGFSLFILFRSSGMFCAGNSTVAII